MVARNHHYISKCYLKGFAKNPDKPQLYVVDSKRKKTYLTSTDNIGSRRDFHRIEIEGLAPDALENALAGFEGPLAEALRRIEDCRSLDNFDDRTFLLNLIGLIHIKNPQMRNVFHDFDEKRARRIMEIITSNKKVFDNHVRQAKEQGYIDVDDDVDYQTMKKFINEDGFVVEIPTEKHLLREIDLLDTVLPYLFERKWHILKAPKGETGFITSDHPVILQWQDPKLRDRLYHPGLGLKNTELLFPICNSLAILGTFEGNEMVVDLTTELLAKINGIIISKSNHQIYARDDNFLYMFDDSFDLQNGKTLIKYFS